MIDFKEKFKKLSINKEYREFIDSLTEDDYELMSLYHQRKINMLEEWRKIQTRPFLRINKKLMVSAQLRATSIGLVDDWSLEWGKLSPNQIVRTTGYNTPKAYYPDDENQVESIFRTNDLSFDYLPILDLLTDPNKTTGTSIYHMNGLNTMYNTQYECGLGYWETKENLIWVFHTAHTEGVLQ